MVLETARPAAPPSASSSTAVRRSRPPAVIGELLGLHVGEPLEKVVAAVGGPSRANDFETERNEWLELGYDTSSELPFLIGFDRAVTFDAPGLPVYMVFAKDGLVTLIRFSSYVVPPEVARKLTLDERCGLLSAPDCVERAFGQGFLDEEKPLFARTVHHYTQLGFSVTLEEDAVRVVDIYGALPQESLRRVERGIKHAAGSVPD